MTTTRFLFPLLLVASILGGCTQDLTRPVAQGAIQLAPSVPMDELPMYGGINRDESSALRAADAKFVAAASQEFGSRSVAAVRWVGHALDVLQHGDTALAMRRLNQAWLLDPRNPQVYAAFGTALHSQGNDCSAMKLMNKALSMMPPTNQGIYTDAARIVALCAAGSRNITADARAEMLKHSDLLFKAAEELEPNKGYLYASWADALHARGQYADAWSMVAKARAIGADPGKTLLAQLQASMPEPSRST